MSVLPLKIDRLIDAGLARIKTDALYKKRASETRRARFRARTQNT